MTGPVYEVTSTSRVAVENDTPLTAAVIQDWVATLPAHAVLRAIIRDLGDQRDPLPTMVGMEATWDGNAPPSDRPLDIVYAPLGADERPHSRACDLTRHQHGPECARDCPTCHGVD